jgi:hypothetical protein
MLPHGGKRNAIRILAGKPGDHWEDPDVGRKMNFKMDLGEIGWGGTDWIDLAQERDQWKVLMNMVRNLRVP